MGLLEPPLRTDTAAPQVPQKGVHTQGAQSVGSVVGCCRKGQAGAFGAVFQRLTVWGPLPPPFSLPGAHTWHLSGKVIS